MRIEENDENHLTIYYSLILDDILEYDIEDLKIFIKMLVVTLRKKYHINLKGYYNLHVHIKKILILEFEKIDDYEDEIDLNITIHTKTPIFIKFEDYFLIPGNKYYYLNYFYMPIEQVEYEKYIEFIDFIYGNEAEKVQVQGLKL